MTHKPILLLRLEGPLQSWGIRSRWDVRDTQPEPTKSGIVGLLGCALGYPVGDPRLETELDAVLQFGVRIEHPGKIMRDYQTVSDFLPTADGRYRHSGISVGASLDRIRSDPNATPATIVSPRFYLEDAAFLVALRQSDASSGSDLLARCAEAVQHPKWPMFLGRKACVPTRPIFHELTMQYADLDDVFRHHPWSWLGASNANRRNVPPTLTAYLEVGPAELGPSISQRQDAVRINAARQYGFRNARRIGNIPTPLEAKGDTL